MIRNVLDVDLHSMKISLNSERGVLVRFDFEAAFPSISQEYLLHMLDVLGAPPRRSPDWSKPYTTIADAS